MLVRLLRSRRAFRGVCRRRRRCRSGYCCFEWARGSWVLSVVDEWVGMLPLKYHHLRWDLRAVLDSRADGHLLRSAGYLNSSRVGQALLAGRGRRTGYFFARGCVLLSLAALVFAPVVAAAAAAAAAAALCLLSSDHVRSWVSRLYFPEPRFIFMSTNSQWLTFRRSSKYSTDQWYLAPISQHPRIL